MSKKLIPRDKGRVAQAAKQQTRAAAKTSAGDRQRARPSGQGQTNRARSAKAAPQKSGIAGFFQRLFGRFKR